MLRRAFARSSGSLEPSATMSRARSALTVGRSATEKFAQIGPVLVELAQQAVDCATRCLAFVDIVRTKLAKEFAKALARELPDELGHTVTPSQLWKIRHLWPMRAVTCDGTAPASRIWGMPTSGLRVLVRRFFQGTSPGLNPDATFWACLNAAAGISRTSPIWFQELFIALVLPLFAPVLLNRNRDQPAHRFSPGRNVRLTPPPFVYHL